MRVMVTGSFEHPGLIRTLDSAAESSTALRSKMQAFDIQWVAQVSLLSKGLAGGKWRVEGTRFCALSPPPVPGAPHPRFPV
jgi:hypothetical protein